MSGLRYKTERLSIMIRRDWRNKVVLRNNTPFADCKGRFLIHGKIVVSRLFSLDSIREKKQTDLLG